MGIGGLGRAGRDDRIGVQQEEIAEGDDHGAGAGGFNDHIDVVEVAHSAVLRNVPEDAGAVAREVDLHFFFGRNIVPRVVLVSGKFGIHGIDGHAVGLIQYPSLVGIGHVGRDEFADEEVDALTEGAFPVLGIVAVEHGAGDRQASGIIRTYQCAGQGVGAVEVHTTGLPVVVVVAGTFAVDTVAVAAFDAEAKVLLVAGVALPAVVAVTDAVDTVPVGTAVNVVAGVGVGSGTSNSQHAGDNRHQKGYTFHVFFLNFQTQ